MTANPSTRASIYYYHLFLRSTPCSNGVWFRTKQGPSSPINAPCSGVTDHGIACIQKRYDSVLVISCICIKWSTTLLFHVRGAIVWTDCNILTENRDVVTIWLRGSIWPISKREAVSLGLWNTLNPNMVSICDRRKMFNVYKQLWLIPLISLHISECGMLFARRYCEGTFPIIALCFPRSGMQCNLCIQSKEIEMKKEEVTKFGCSSKYNKAVSRIICWLNSSISTMTQTGTISPNHLIALLQFAVRLSFPDLQTMPDKD